MPSAPLPSPPDPRRRTAWELLSRLFLDTDYTNAELDALATDLSRTNYSLSELEDILFDEVYPVCAPNLSNPIGDWSHYDPAWLESEITRRPIRRTTALRRAWRRRRLRVCRGDWWLRIRAALERASSPVRN